jgi:hypothetical protein
MLTDCAPVTDQASVVVWSLVIFAGVAAKLVIAGSGTLAVGGGVESPQAAAARAAIESARWMTIRDMAIGRLPVTRR